MDNGLHIKLKWLSKIFLIVFVTICIFLLYQHFQPLKEYFVSTQWRFVFIMIIAQAFFVMLGGLTFSLLCQAKNIQTLWYEWMGLAFFSNFLNQLLPYRPGLVIRYVYLKRNYHIAIKHYITINFYFFLIFTLVGCLFCGVGFIFLPHDIKMKFVEYNLTNTHILVALTLLFTALALLQLIITIIKAPETKNAIMHIKHALLSANVKGFIVMIFAHLFLSTGFICAFWAFNMPIPPIEAIFISGAVSLSILFPITPGNVGVLEPIIGALTHWWYGDFSLGLAVCLLYRAALLVSASIGCSIFFIALADKIPSRKQIKNWTNQVR